MRLYNIKAFIGTLRLPSPCCWPEPTVANPGPQFAYAQHACSSYCQDFKIVQHKITLQICCLSGGGYLGRLSAGIASFSKGRTTAGNIRKFGLSYPRSYLINSLRSLVSAPGHCSSLPMEGFCLDSSKCRAGLPKPGCELNCGYAYVRACWHARPTLPQWSWNTSDSRQQQPSRFFQSCRPNQPAPRENNSLVVCCILAGRDLG
jgi:hypothetical protein